MSYILHTKAEEVRTPETFASYAQSRLGCPYPTGKDIAVTKKKVKEFFVQYPDLDYRALVRVVDWCAAEKRRFSHVYQVVGQYRYAYQAGVLGALIRVRADTDLEEGIASALEVETDETWRQRLSNATGQARVDIFDVWKGLRRPELVGA